MRNKIEIFIFILITIVCLTATRIYVFVFTPPDVENTPKTISVQQGASFRIIARELESNRIVTDAHKFFLLAEFKGVLKRIQAGEYEFTTSMLPIQVLDKLVRGNVKEYSITIPEGYNIIEIAETLDAQGFIKKEEFITMSTDKSLVTSLNIDWTSIEGYLFPDTYKLTKGMNAGDIIKKMVSRFKEVYDSNLKEKARRINLSDREVVTLASIIEKETGNPEERYLISAVFHNRLKRGMRLESDPTVIYGIKDFSGNITKKELNTKTDYNTYLIYGLPPGPIASPGKAALEAAVNPADDGYIFFVSKNDGTHHFSKDLEEHNRAVNIYQRGSKNNF
ncbi:MAG: hypothetical protein A2073_03915 [Deltaproteobacteria bacterium GWC2_42_11]|nr:MAG: hypothetical protein A2073_03915 [Deltaproteobacteria bacterium GWC2_42_11]